MPCCPFLWPPPPAPGSRRQPCRPSACRAEWFSAGARFPWCGTPFALFGSTRLRLRGLCASRAPFPSARRSWQSGRTGSGGALGPCQSRQSTELPRHRSPSSPCTPPPCCSAPTLGSGRPQTRSRSTQEPRPTLWLGSARYLSAAAPPPRRRLFPLRSAPLGQEGREGELPPPHQTKTTRPAQLHLPPRRLPCPVQGPPSRPA
mmetsp:Transcript_19173/g.32525  ORF Transcript_19173/g.32525 Transcript_19173/m.32525 type:complete len:203 (-) Transcript_19173:605-1213(-)